MLGSFGKTFFFLQVDIPAYITIYILPNNLRILRVRIEVDFCSTFGIRQRDAFYCAVSAPSLLSIYGFCRCFCCCFLLFMERFWQNE